MNGYAYHVTDERAAEMILDAFKRKVAGELELLDVTENKWTAKTSDFSMMNFCEPAITWHDQNLLVRYPVDFSDELCLKKNKKKTQYAM